MSKRTLLKEKANGFDLDMKITKTQVFLSQNMNSLYRILDEYRPMNLHFILVDETYDLYDRHNKRENFLYEMVSGAAGILPQLIIVNYADGSDLEIMIYYNQHFEKKQILMPMNILWSIQKELNFNSFCMLERLPDKRNRLNIPML